jgi:MFS family permease
VGGGLRTRGIAVVVGATVTMALGFGSLGLISVFMRPLETDLGWSRADISLAYAVATVGMAVGGVVWGWISDRVDMRVVLAIGGSGIVLSLLGMAAAQSLWHFHLAHLVLSGLGFSALYAPLLGAAGDWFQHRRGLAVGVVTAGGALGQGVLPFLGNVLIDGVGWRLAFLSLAVLALVALAATLPRVRRPDGGKADAVPHTATAGGGLGAAGLLLTMLSVAAFLCCVCMGVPLVHLASFVGAICGSPAIGATSLLVAMLCGAVGRVFFGVVADRIGYLPTYAVASATQTACVVLYPVLDSSLSLLALSAVFGFGFAGNMTALALCVRDAVPVHRFGVALGIAMLAAWAGMGVGGYAGGALFDIYLSYTLSFMLAGVAGVLNLVALAAAMHIRRKARHRPPLMAPLGAAPGRAAVGAAGGR